MTTRTTKVRRFLSGVPPSGKLHLWNYFEAVRSRKPVVEDVVFGHNAALACHMANEAYARRSAVTWDEASKTIRG